MSDALPREMEYHIARCRIVLSVVAFVAVFVDPTEPMMSYWLPMEAGSFVIDPHALAVLAAHLCYGSIVMVLTSRHALPPRFVTVTNWLDVVFAAAIAAVTEGVSSPMYAFFVFAVMVAGLTAGLRRALTVSAVGIALYLSLIAVSATGRTNFYIMRPVYLAISAYLVGYLGQQRLNLEGGIRRLAAAQQRERIARDLHDGQSQALAAIALSLESCQQLLQRGALAKAMSQLADLQNSVNREYDELRVYTRALVGLHAAPAPPAAYTDTRFSVDIELNGSAELIEHVVKILREGMANVCRHAQAGLAAIRVRPVGPGVVITIDDNGLGFGDGGLKPWTIVSLVADLGGTVTVASQDRPGGHLAITLPGE